MPARRYYFSITLPLSPFSPFSLLTFSALPPRRRDFLRCQFHFRHWLPRFSSFTLILIAIIDDAAFAAMPP
jgi:hypothetical protein